MLSADRLVLVFAVSVAAALGTTAVSRLGASSEPRRIEASAPADPPSPPSAAASAAPRRAGSPVRANVTVQRYRVTGHDAASLLDALRAGGPRVDGDIFFGLTTTAIAYRYATHERPGRCQTADAHVDMTVTITLPEWSAPRRAPFELSRDWARFAAALQRHEEHHRDLAVEQAHALQRAVEGLVAPTCEAVAALAQARARAVQDAAEAAHRAYDARTGHGESEGAVWPPR